jgi:secreted PhoX family phosphatase
MKTTRRELIVRSAVAGATIATGWRAMGAPRARAAGGVGYGPLGTPDANGVSLPAGFHARLLAKSGQPVLGTGYVWHGEPDGAGTFPLPNGGWVLTSNSELNGTAGGASAIRFSSSGQPTHAYRILGGTKWSCAGGATPWGTWLSCEEFRNGLVWECDPFRAGTGVARPGLGVFPHEAAPVDRRTGYVYLTEDDYGARLYRFRPDHPGDLRSGVLEAAAVVGGGAVTWVAIPPTHPYRGDDTAPFERPEGAWVSRDVLYFATTADHRVWALDLLAMRLSVIYDGLNEDAFGPLHDPDNVTVHERTGHLYVAEDPGDIQLVQLVHTATDWVAAPFLQFVGHDGSEVTGPAFSPDGSRLYVTSQRGFDGDGMTFEITGPFARR